MGEGVPIYFRDNGIGKGIPGTNVKIRLGNGERGMMAQQGKIVRWLTIRLARASCPLVIHNCRAGLIFRPRRANSKAAQKGQKSA